MAYPITDILSYSKKLKAAGESEAVAETHAEMIGKLIESTLATKEDLKNLATKGDLAKLEIATKEILTKSEVATKQNFTKLEAAIEKTDLKLNWIIALIGIFGTLVSAGNGLMALLHHMQWT